MEQLKKAIIVVGKMGHGKSAFLKTLSQPRNDSGSYRDSKIMIHTGLKNGTHDCSIFLVDPSHNLLGNQEPVWMIDSPGIDSDISVSLIIQMMDEILMEEKCQVIGIAYIIDITQREQDRKKKSFFRQFLTNLKLKMETKKKIIFVCATKWDKFFDQQESIPKYMLGLQEILKECNCSQAFQKVIKWSSKPIDDFKKYRRTFMNTQEGKQFVEDQWRWLKKILQQQKKDSCSFQSYRELYENFWRSYVTKIMKYLISKSEQISFQNKQYTFPFQFQRQQNLSLKKIVPPITVSVVANVSRLSLAFALPCLALSGPIGISIMIGSLVLGVAWGGRSVYKVLKQRYKYEINEEQKDVKNDEQKEKKKKELEQKINDKIFLVLSSQLRNTIQIQNHLLDQEITFKIPKLDWLQAVEIYSQPHHSEPIKVQQRKKGIFTSRLQRGQRNFIFWFKTRLYLPTLDSSIKLFEQQVSTFYNSS